MKVAVAISLVGAIVGELPTGAVAGLGAALSPAPITARQYRFGRHAVRRCGLAGTLVAFIGIAHRLVLRRMGMAA